VNRVACAASARLPPPRFSLLTTLAMRPSMRPNDHGHPVVPVTHSVGQRMDCRYASIMDSDR